jgi:hypothetical protein
MVNWWKSGLFKTAASEYNNASNVGYGKYGSVSLGGLPDYNSFSSYAKRIVYRGGLKYEKTGLVVNGESINDVGLTLGLVAITGTILMSLDLN